MLQVGPSACKTVTILILIRVGGIGQPLSLLLKGNPLVTEVRYVQNGSKTSQTNH